jgi:Family of unknown function (DUF6496)
VKRKSKAQRKVSRVMREYAKGKLHSGSKHGPKVTSRKQAIAIAMGEAVTARGRGRKARPRRRG